MSKMDSEFIQTVVKNISDLWITPEIERRKSSGKIQDDFILNAAQIVFSMEKAVEIRLNSEVKAIAMCKVNKPVVKGDPVYEGDVEEIEGITLTDDDKNCAHITLVKIGERWISSFDFRYNKEMAAEHVKAAQEFYDSAECNLNAGRLRPFFEDSFATAELAAKSILLLLPSEEILHGKNHPSRQKIFKNWTELGNAPIEYSGVLGELARMRPSARYLETPMEPKIEPNTILQTLKAMIEFSRKESV